MPPSSKKSNKPNTGKKQALAKQALKKNNKKSMNDSHKSKNAQLLEVLDQKALATLKEASNNVKPIQADFSAYHQATEAQNSINDLTSFMQKI